MDEWMNDRLLCQEKAYLPLQGPGQIKLFELSEWNWKFPSLHFQSLCLCLSGDIRYGSATPCFEDRDQCVPSLSPRPSWSSVSAVLRELTIALLEPKWLCSCTIRYLLPLQKRTVMKVFLKVTFKLSIALCPCVPHARKIWKQHLAEALNPGV